MLTCIMAGVLALTRLLFSVLYKYITFKWWHYVLWCLGEVLVTSFFFALYASLFYINSGGMPYFSALSYSFEILLLTLIYPYVIAITMRIINNKSSDLENAVKEPEDTLIKFYDGQNELICSKVGTTTQLPEQRLAQEIKYYREHGIPVERTEICSVIDCGTIPAEGAESITRAAFIRKYPDAFKKNDRFFGIDIPAVTFNRIVKNYLAEQIAY